jgi:hypothetical protein
VLCSDLVNMIIIWLRYYCCELISTNVRTAIDLLFALSCRDNLYRFISLSRGANRSLFW